MFFRYRALLFTTFDPEVAEVSGVSPGRIDALLMLMLAASILATMQILGVVLVAATLVVPAAVARLLTNSFSHMLGLSAVIGAVSGFVGMNLSYHLDISSGATIVLVSRRGVPGGVPLHRSAGASAAHSRQRPSTAK